MTDKDLLPPPSRTPDSIRSRPHTPETPGQRRKTWWTTKGKVWGDKAQGWSDTIGGKVNSFAENRLGAEAFYPVTGDMPKEMDKAARILKAFTEDGIITTEKTDSKNKKRVLRKIPSKVIRNAKGLAIFTSMRSGIAPFGGAGGAGLVVAKLPDGSWSAPSSITPNNLSAGLLLGVDIYDCVLVINSQKALDSFGTHKVTLGTEIAVVAGPWGAGAAMESGYDRSPVFSYVKSRGLYAGVEVVGQVFIERFDENGLMYHWPGVKARDILTGKVDVPREAWLLQQALKDAESGRAQARTLGGALEAEVDKNGNPLAAIPLDELTLDEGEVLKLPPTPDMTDGHECESDPETEEIIRRSGLNPPALPPRRGTAPPTMDGAAAPASTSLPRVPPPLPHRPGEQPPSYEASEEVNVPGDAPFPVDAAPAPEGPPPVIRAATADAVVPVTETVVPVTGADIPVTEGVATERSVPEAPIAPFVDAAPEGAPPAAAPEYNTLEHNAPEYNIPEHNAPEHNVPELSPPAPAPVAHDAPPAPPRPTRAAGHTLSPTSPTSPLSSVSCDVQTPASPAAPTLPELIAMGAPETMDDAERREWEQAYAEAKSAEPKEPKEFKEPSASLL